ncbi:MAG: hypothetical protein ABFD10_22465 [Prolixibacteraceae bacterium]
MLKFNVPLFISTLCHNRPNRLGISLDVRKSQKMIQEEVEAYYLKKPDQVLWPDISQEQTLRLVRKFPSNELKMLYLHSNSR